MPNLNYKIKEKSRSRDPVNVYTLLSEVTQQNISHDEKSNCCDIVYAHCVDYNTNYTVKQLAVILDYYNISKRKLKKSDMIDLIICFENDTNNIDKVEKRKRLWKHVAELKQDQFFTKYLIIEL